MSRKSKMLKAAAHNAAKKKSAEVKTVNKSEEKVEKPVVEDPVKPEVEPEKKAETKPEVKPEVKKDSSKEDANAKIEQIAKESEKEVEAKSKEESSKEPAKEVKPKKENKQKPKEEPEEVIPEVVAPEKKTFTEKAKPYQSMALNNLAKGDRISADQGITLMNLIHHRYLSNPDLSTEFKNAMSQQFDAMALASLIHWNEQTKLELGETGINVNKELFDAISDGLATYFGIEIKSLPSDNSKQLKIDFDTPVEIKKEVENRQRVKKDGPLPTYDKNKKEEEVISDLETILAASNGMGPNLENAITYAKKAFAMEKDSPEKVLCTIMGKLTHSNVLLNGWGRAVFGSMTINDSPFTGISLIKKHLPKWSDANIVALSKILFSLGAQIEINTLNKTKEPKITDIDYLKPWNNLFKSLNDKIINDIVATTSNGQTVKVPKIDGLSTDNFDSKKIIDQIKSAYGNTLNDKQVKKTMSMLLNLFQKEEVKPLSNYVEKGYVVQ